MGTNMSTYNPKRGDVDGLIQALNYSVVCGIEIKNSTKDLLHSPKTTVQWGYLLSPPPTSIRPDEKGCFIGHKHSLSVTGTTGVVSYLIGTKKQRMVIMWASPYNFDFYKNYLAVGFIQNHDDDIYHRMYNDEEKNFSKESYSRSCNVVTKKSEYFTIEGIMGTAHKSKVEVELLESGKGSKCG